MKHTLNTRYNPTVLSTIEAAVRFVNRCEKLHMIVMGDNCKFWVCTPADAQKLVKSGYEYAKY
jgi:hypothetical protein